MIVAVNPMIAGDCLHLFFGDSDIVRSSQGTHADNHTHCCSHDHPADRQNDTPVPAPLPHDQDSCFICKFLAIPLVTAVFVAWLPETQCLENHDVVFSFLYVTTWQNFEFGRAPPSFA